MAPKVRGSGRIDLCSKVETVEQAADLLCALAERCAAERPCGMDEALKITRSNIGYLGGYCDVETQRRWERLFGAVHPVFGSVDSPESPKTAAETFARGVAMAKEITRV
jgi:hypothetical protein